MNKIALFVLLSSPALCLNGAAQFEPVIEDARPDSALSSEATHPLFSPRSAQTASPCNLMQFTAHNLRDTRTTHADTMGDPITSSHKALAAQLFKMWDRYLDHKAQNPDPQLRFSTTNLSPAISDEELIRTLMAAQVQIQSNSHH